MSAWRFKILGYPVGIAQPMMFLLCALAVAVLLIAFVVAWRRTSKVADFLSARFIPRLAPGVSQFRAVLQASLSGTALLLFAVALTQPQCGDHAETSKKRGVDVVVALDASKSMLARDVSPNRLDRAKLELLTLLDELKGDRVGLVVFAGDAYVQCPLTSDYDAAKLFLRAVDPAQMAQGGTEIGDALRLSKQVLDSADRGGSADKVVILISDGEDLGGEAVSAADQLGDAGIHLYAVGIGSETGEPIPELDRNGEMAGYVRDASGNTVLTRLDKATLEKMAKAGGGEFFHRAGGVAMSDVVDRIDKLRKSELESRVTIRYDERFQDFALPGFFLYAAALLIPAARRRATA